MRAAVTPVVIAARTARPVEIRQHDVSPPRKTELTACRICPVTAAADSAAADAIASGKNTLGFRLLKKLTLRVFVKISFCFLKKKKKNTSCVLFFLVFK